MLGVILELLVDPVLSHLQVTGEYCVIQLEKKGDRREVTYSF
jgi:hypothetical protein